MSCSLWIQVSESTDTPPCCAACLPGIYNISCLGLFPKIPMRKSPWFLPHHASRVSGCWASPAAHWSAGLSVVPWDERRLVREACVVCPHVFREGSGEQGTWCVWCPAAAHQSESRDILPTSREQWCGWHLIQDLLANGLVLPSGEDVFRKKPPLQVTQEAGGYEHFKPSWPSRSSLAIWSCKECAEVRDGGLSLWLSS